MALYDLSTIISQTKALYPNYFRNIICLPAALIDGFKTIDQAPFRLYHRQFHHAMHSLGAYVHIWTRMYWIFRGLLCCAMGDPAIARLYLHCIFRNSSDCHASYQRYDKSHFETTCQIEASRTKPLGTKNTPAPPLSGYASHATG